MNLKQRKERNLNKIIYNKELMHGSRQPCEFSNYPAVLFPVTVITKDVDVKTPVIVKLKVRI